MEDLSKVKFNGEKLFKIRKKKRMSQEILAAKVGVTRQTIYSWESNQRLPDVEKVGRLCKVLNINLSDLVDGIVEQENSEEIQMEKQSKEKTRNMKMLIIKIIILIFITLIIIYSVISTIKFIRLNKIDEKWKELDEIVSYCIKEKKSIQIDKENVTTFRNIYYEKYYNNGVLKTIVKDSQNIDIEIIIIDDCNDKIKYIIDEKNKTYVKRKNTIEKNNIKLMDNFEIPFEYSNNSFRRYLFCMNPKFSILYNESYECEISEKIKMYINKDTGLPTYIETFNEDFLSSKQYYEYELNTGKDFEINLADYTEVTE